MLRCNFDWKSAAPGRQEWLHHGHSDRGHSTAQQWLQQERSQEWLRHWGGFPI